MSRDFSTVVDDTPSDKPSTRAPGLYFDIKRFFSLRLPGVLLITVVLAVPFSLAGWFLTPVEYLATSQIQYSSLENSIADMVTANSAEYEKFVNTEINKLTGDDVLRAVLNKPSISKLPSVVQAQEPLIYLRSRITVRQIPRSELVSVVCAMPTRQAAVEVLKALTQIYVDQTLLTANELGRERIETVQKEINRLDVKMKEARQRMEDMQGELRTSAEAVNPQDSIEAEQYREAMLQAESRLKDAQRVAADAQDQLTRLEAAQTANKSNPSAPIYDFGIETIVRADPRVSVVQSDLVRQQGIVDALRETHKDGHPELKAQVRSLESLQKSLLAQESVARSGALQAKHGELAQSLESATRGVDNATENLNSNSARLTDHLTQAQADAKNSFEERAALDKLKEEDAADRASIEGWKTKLQNMILEGQAPARIKIVSDEPYAPESAAKTKKLLMAFMGFAAAACIGMAFGVLRELMDGQVRAPHDIKRVTSLPIIASIPHFSEDPLLASADTALLMAQHPNSIIADEYRRILARILFPEDNAAEISSLMVVSASRSEGKTSVACNLAVALEHANRRVLLIDLSSQRPGIETTFGLVPGLGLAELLENLDGREELIRRTEFENLGIIGPGLDPRALAGRLASREMMDFMEWADEHFDHIIIDTPPLLLMSDAKLIAPAIDGVLFVVGVGHSTLGMVSRGLRDLELLRANTVGVVLNGVRSLRGGYMKQNQKLFYDYANQTAPRVRPAAMPDINILDEDISEAVDAEVVLLPLEKRKD